MTPGFSQWMNGHGPEGEIVLSSRIRLARNLAGVPFPHRMDDQQGQHMLEQVEHAVGQVEPGWGIRFRQLDSLTPLERQLLMEKHLVSPLLIQNPIRYESVALDERESISIMVNEEDHLRIQVLLPGLQLDEAWQAANRLDDALEQHLDFAYDESRGYLTAWPTNLGTGLRASVMLHLPGLVMTRQASQVFTTLAQVGIVVRGLYGEGSEALGNIFQISNQVSLGLTEEELVHNLTVVAQQIVGRERNARQHLMSSAGLALADRVGRSWGILTNARVMTSDEALKLLSDVQLGSDLNLLEGPLPCTFSQLTLMTRPAYLQIEAGRELSPVERDQIRAQTLRRHLLGKD
ncbi:protein arginine kinase [Sulfobacillus harzensis]|uniref:Protein-arginine kinase n=1 Tax=Sulfobacillus harzensis TaxID=2729629 RepID=A0A7Y0L2L3_9FIRM|nr:protein arginine kinase [Sulfobacillus harzensis]NMP22154.1 protein arginine kinase [Sulfobacillus harzensis]